MRNWEISFGFYPGILIGFRSYEHAGGYNHVLYIPFVDICITIGRAQDESNK